MQCLVGTLLCTRICNSFGCHCHTPLRKSVSLCAPCRSDVNVNCKSLTAFRRTLKTYCFQFAFTTPYQGPIHKCLPIFTRSWRFMNNVLVLTCRRSFLVFFLQIFFEQSAHVIQFSQNHVRDFLKYAGWKYFPLLMWQSVAQPRNCWPAFRKIRPHNFTTRPHK